MNVQEFLRRFAKVDLPGVVLFCPAKGLRGKEPTFEPLLAEMAAARIVDARVDPSLRDMAYTVYYADETPASEIVLEARTLPFLAERRVVLVRGAERYNLESTAGPLLHYIQNQADTTVLLFIAATIDKRFKFYKACEKNGLVIECPELTRQEMARWLVKTIETEGRTIEPAAVDELLRRAGTHLSDVKNALEIVLGYVENQSRIRLADVVSACADVAEEQVWTLTDSIAASQPAVAIEALRKLTDLGKDEDELLGIINWMLKSAYLVAKDETGSNLNYYVKEKTRPLARKLGLSKLRAAFALATETQFLMRSTGVDRSLALELLVIKLAAPAKSAATAC